MPFTFSHPAIVLPLINWRKRIFSSSGLIVGSLIPDFESVLRLNERKIYGHNWLGIFWYDLPLAIIFIFIFHNIVRDPLIINLPKSISNKFVNYIGFNWNKYFLRKFIVIIASTLIGIASHLFWDGFTHLNFANPNAIDSDLYFGGRRIFKILQYSNSVIGLIIVIWYLIQLPSHEIPRKKNEKMIFGIQRKKLDRQSKIQFWILITIITSVTILLTTNLIDCDIDIILFIYIFILGLLFSLIFTPIIQRLLALIPIKN